MEDGSDAPNHGAPPESVEAIERMRRIEALGDLARQHGADDPGALSQPSRRVDGAGRVGAMPHAQPRRARARWVAVAMVVVAVCLVAVVVFNRAGQSSIIQPPTQPTGAPIPDPLVIDLGKQETRCASQLAWSPDDTEVAVAVLSACNGTYLLPGDDRPVPGGPIAGAGIAVYSTLSGYHVATYDLSGLLSDLVPGGMSTNPQAGDYYALVFSRLLWSRDGQQILAEVTSVRAGHGANAVTSGQVFAQQLVDILQSNTSYSFSLPAQTVQHPDRSSAYLWIPNTFTLSVIPLPPAITYAWKDDGTLAAAELLSSLSSPPSPIATVGSVGDPSGGTRFTMWQQGIITRPCVLPLGQISGGCCVPPDYVAGSFGTPAAWSPDSNSVIVPEIGVLGLNGQLATSVTAAMPNTCALPDAPSAASWLPVRDPALAAAVAALPLYAGASTYVAWGASGERVATLPGGREQSDPILTIYDSSSGKPLAQLSIAPLEPPTAQGRTPMIFAPPQWSRQEQRIAVLDTINQVLIIVGHKSLHL